MIHADLPSFFGLGLELRAPTFELLLLILDVEGSFVAQLRKWKLASAELEAGYLHLKVMPSGG